MATVYVPGPSLGEAVGEKGPLPEASVLALAAGLRPGTRRDPRGLPGFTGTSSRLMCCSQPTGPG